MDFYDNLTGDGVFFFWIAIVLALFLVGLAIFLLLKNRKLSTLLKDEKKVVAYPVDNKDADVEIIKDTKEEVPVEVVPVKEEEKPEILQIEEKEKPEVLQIENKKEEIMVPELLQIEDKKEEVLKEKNNNITEDKEVKHDVENKFKFSDDEMPKLFEPGKEVKKEKSTDKESPKPYQKNVLREMSKKMPISPIHIEKEDIDDDKEIYTVSSDVEDTYDLEGIDMGEDSISPLETMEDNYKANDDMKEIVSRMEEEVKPSNIELTDYEKKQEEEAIISYDELQKVKDKIYNLTEEEEDGEFIDELKNFRSDLE